MTLKGIAYASGTAGLFILAISMTVRITRYMDACEAKDLLCIEQKLSVILEARGYIILSETKPQPNKPSPIAQRHKAFREGKEGMKKEEVRSMLIRTDLIHFIRTPENTLLLLEAKIRPGKKRDEGFPEGGVLHRHYGAQDFHVIAVSSLKETTDLLPGMFPFEGVEKVVRNDAAFGSPNKADRWGYSLILIAIIVGSTQVVISRLDQNKQSVVVSVRVSPSVSRKRRRDGPFRVGQPPSTPPVEENPESLRIQALSAISEELLKCSKEVDIQEALVALKNEVLREKRPKKLRYIIEQRIPTIVQEGYDVIEVEEYETIESLPRDRIEERAIDIPLGHLVPEDVSAPCAMAILKELLKVSRDSPYFGLHRCRTANLKQRIVRNFKVEEWEGAFEWLRKERIILHTNMHRTGYACSINPRKQEATALGSIVIGMLVAIRRSTHRR